MFKMALPLAFSALILASCATTSQSAQSLNPESEESLSVQTEEEILPSVEDKTEVEAENEYPSEDAFMSEEPEIDF